MYTRDDRLVDIVVRTSEVYRLRDFLLWQSYQDTYIQVVEFVWPNFGLYDLFVTILSWQKEQPVQEGQKGAPFLKSFLIALFYSAVMTITPAVNFTVQVSFDWT